MTHLSLFSGGANVAIPEEYAVKSPKEMSEYAIRRLAQEFADGIAQFMEVQTMNEPRTHEVRFRARLRVLDSEYRF